MLLCDLNEYEKVVSRFEVGTATVTVTLESVTVTVTVTLQCVTVTVTLEYLMPTPLQVSLVTQLFAGLRELCNLIIIQPEHIRGHCNSELVRAVQSHAHH